MLDDVDFFEDPLEQFYIFAEFGNADELPALAPWVPEPVDEATAEMIANFDWNGQFEGPATGLPMATYPTLPSIHTMSAGRAFPTVKRWIVFVYCACLGARVSVCLALNLSDLFYLHVLYPEPWIKLLDVHCMVHPS